MLPDVGGVYAIVLRLPGATHLRVLGREVWLPAGHYVYVGSARGPGGLRARLGRHLRGDGRPRWHIDALRAAAEVDGFTYWVDEQVTECAVVRAVAALPGATIPIPRFGASDCRQGCVAHLIHVPD
ncbi:MAG: GIY-YIG nuclease family protein [Anaerolineae bacterium]|nr:GIY-YIG nuclease family protein [Anaerolineae bacterium]